MANSTTHKLNHLAIIPDGNTRWAQRNKKPALEGYRQGVQRAIEVARRVRELDIHTVTFWGLSTENWLSRPKKELQFLVRMMAKAVDAYLDDAVQNDVKLIHLGRKDRLPKDLIDRIKEAEEITKHNQSFILNLALDYGGEDELNRAAQAYAQHYKKSPATDKQPVLKDFLDTAGQPYPNPDFIIRTSGEQRTSGFMPLNGLYAELYFEPCFWPEFTVEKLDHAVREYAQRHRRFGGEH